MTANVGRTVQFTWGGSPILGVREKSISLSGEPVDITSDEDGGWRTLLETHAAQNQVDLSLSGVTKDKILKTDWHAGNRSKTVVVTYPDGSTLTGTFLLVNFSEAPAYNDAMPFEAELQSSGEVVFVAGP